MNRKIKFYFLFYTNQLIIKNYILLFSCFLFFSSYTLIFYLSLNEFNFFLNKFSSICDNFVIRIEPLKQENLTELLKFMLSKKNDFFQFFLEYSFQENSIFFFQTQEWNRKNENFLNLDKNIQNFLTYLDLLENKKAIKFSLDLHRLKIIKDKSGINFKELGIEELSNIIDMYGKDNVFLFFEKYLKGNILQNCILSSQIITEIKTIESYLKSFIKYKKKEDISEEEKTKDLSIKNRNKKEKTETLFQSIENKEEKKTKNLFIKNINKEGETKTFFQSIENKEEEKIKTFFQSIENRIKNYNKQKDVEEFLKTIKLSIEEFIEENFKDSKFGFQFNGSFYKYKEIQIISYEVIKKISEIKGKTDARNKITRSLDRSLIGDFLLTIALKSKKHGDFSLIELSYLISIYGYSFKEKIEIDPKDLDEFLAKKIKKITLSTIKNKKKEIEIIYGRNKLSISSKTFEINKIFQLIEKNSFDKMINEIIDLLTKKPFLKQGKMSILQREEINEIIKKHIPEEEVENFTILSFLKLNNKKFLLLFIEYIVKELLKNYKNDFRKKIDEKKVVNKNNFSFKEIFFFWKNNLQIYNTFFLYVFFFIIQLILLNNFTLLNIFNSFFFSFLFFNIILNIISSFKKF